MLSDDGSGSGLVRDAAHLLLAGLNAATLHPGEPLVAALLDSVGVTALDELAVALS